MKIRYLSPLIILCSVLIASFAVDAVAQMRGGWYANQSMMRQNQMMQQQRAAQQRQAMQAQQRRQQQAMQQQRAQRQQALQAQRQRVQQQMQKRQQAIASKRAAMQKRQRTTLVQRQSAIKSRQSTALAKTSKPTTGLKKNSVVQKRSIRQQRLAKERTERLRKLRLQRDKEQAATQKQKLAKQQSTTLPLSTLAARSRVTNTQPALKPKTTASFKQARLSSKTATTTTSQKLKKQRDYVQARAKQLKNLTLKKPVAKPKADTQAKQKTKNAASKNFGACDVITKKCVCSFDGDTGVLTSKGTVKIRDITPGNNLVWSKNDKTGDASWQPVLAQYSNHYESQVHIELASAANDNSYTIVSNQIHPFFVIQTGLRPVSSVGGMVQAGEWVQAQDLRQGDTLLSAENIVVEIERVSFVPQAFEAFNLHVANNNTYFVTDTLSTGNDSVWVHNDCPSKNKTASNLKSVRPSVAKGVTKLLTSTRQSLLNSVTDKKLLSRIDKLYRQGAKIGNGGTADAIRYELKTGKLLSPKGHSLKGIEMRNGLMKDIKSGRLNKTDTRIAKGLVRDLQNALSGQ